MFWIVSIFVSGFITLFTSLPALGHAGEAVESFDLQIHLERGGQVEKVARVASTSEGCMSWSNKQSRMESDDFCRKTLKAFRSALNAAPKAQVAPSDDGVYIAQLQTADGKQLRRLPAGKTAPLLEAISSLVNELK